MLVKRVEDSTPFIGEVMDKDLLALTPELILLVKKVITVDANDPQIKNWKDFIKETKDVLNISKGGGYFFAKYFH